MTAPQPPRATPSRAEWLAERCSDRDAAILGSLNRLRLATGSQLERLHFADLAGRSRAVTRWRVLRRMTDWGLIVPLERRIGGSARGSAGMVYALDTGGARVLGLAERQAAEGRRIRRPSAPGERKVRHSLAVAELYAELVEGSRASGYQLARYDVEPRYANGGGWLSPDAYAVLVAAQVVDYWFIEVDRATETPDTVRRKLHAYAAFYQQGRWSHLGVMPRVLLCVPDVRRCEALASVVPSEAKIFTEIQLQGTSASYIAHTTTYADS